MNADRPGPLIIVGTGRCGSTLLHRLLALHEDLGWISTFNEVFPRQPWLSASSQLYRAPLPRRVKEARWFPKPFEAYRFWEAYLPGFSRRDRPPRAEDLTEPGIEGARSAVERVLRWQRRPRLLVKVTGWSRISLFNRVFGDAVFVALRREPCAVVSSWIQAGWLDVTSPPSSERWQWGSVPVAYERAWRELGADPVLTAALKMRLDLDNIEAESEEVPGRFREFRFEDLISRPEPTLRELCGFAGLRWTPSFERAVRGMPFADPREKWRECLSPEQGDLVLEFMRRTAGAGGGLEEPQARA